MIRPRARRRASEAQAQDSSLPPKPVPPLPQRTSSSAAALWVALLLIILHASWFVYYYQFLKLPTPLSASDAGKRGFSEKRAYSHVKFLTSLGPHPVGSQALDQALEYVLSRAEEVQAEAPWDVDVDIDFFHAKPGISSLVGGLFKGKSLIYSNLKHIVVRVKPASVPGAEKHSLLVSSHVDTVITAPGAGDCNSNIGVMLELIRAVSQWAHGFKHSTVFLFNTGEEEGLDGAHGFITQHPWRSSIRAAVDLESIGVGGVSILFQGGPDKAIVELYAKVAKHPAAQILAQDVFLSGFIKSATDFQVYKEVANLSGLDFAFMENVAVYHTKNDKIELLTPGSLQHIGDNILALLLEAAVSDKLPFLSPSNSQSGAPTKMESVYFDVLGKFFITYSQDFAKLLYSSVIMQSWLLILVSSFQGGWTSVKAFLLSLQCLTLSWTFSLIVSALAALGLSFLSYSAIPYIAHRWLAAIYFGIPALFGALVGHHIGYKLLKANIFKDRQIKSKSLQKSFKKNDLRLTDLQQSSKEIDLRLATWDAERWLFKAGFLQWLGILMIGTWFEIGSSYVAMIWLISPALAYGWIDATFSPQRAPLELKIMTLLAALLVPLVSSAGSIIHFYNFMVGNLVRLDRNPGMNPAWTGNLIMAILTAIIVCLFLVYLLPFANRSGSLKWILCGLLLAFAMVSSLFVFEAVPPFTEHCGRAVNVVNVVEVGTGNDEQLPISYVSLSSLTPGKLTRELSFIKDEGFVCETGDGIDMVSHIIKYGCTSYLKAGVDDGDFLNEVPTLKLHEEKQVEGNIGASFLLNAKAARRWVLAINATNLISFQLLALQGESGDKTGDKEVIASRQSPSSVDGWHTIQFVTDQAGPSYFELFLVWSGSTPLLLQRSKKGLENKDLLLKLRTDVNKTTPKLKRTLEKLPSWVSDFGKSTSPYPLSYIVKFPTIAS